MRQTSGSEPIDPDDMGPLVIRAKTQPAARTRTSSWVLAVWLVCLVSALAMLASDRYWHWFMAPTSLAGVLIGVDAVDWARGRLGAFSPVALVGLLGVHMFYAVPMFHVYWDTWPLFVEPVRDWRNALGVVGCVTVVGLLIYRLVLKKPIEVPASAPHERLDRRTFKIAATVAVIIGLVAFTYNVASYGGPLSYFTVLSDIDGRADALAGHGWLLLLAESWPLVLFVSIVVLRRRQLASHPVQILALIALFVVALFLVGGLRGSRANTVWPLLIGLGVTHLAVRSIRKRVLAIGALIIISFSWVYGIYKTHGDATLSVVSASGLYTAAEEANRSVERMVLEDFGRAGIQAVVADRSLTGRVPPVLGQTYLGAGLLLVPDGLIHDPPQSKVEAGTNLLYGADSFVPGQGSSRIYGLVGESIMNWGVWLAPIPFLVFGGVVRAAERLYRRRTLSAAILAPVASVSCILLLGSDLDNTIFFLLKHGAPLACVVFLSRRAADRAGRSGIGEL